ncbi:MAG: hypothetical protein L0G94_15185 [Brachybacterium sp.]|nr:hypothetical protein [Brachybacterium sp.]MDN5688001.1 hypothetical protein [Brachybacterium sp.]
MSTTTTQRPPVKRTPQQVLNGTVRDLLADAHRDGVHPYNALMNALRAR